ncbi:MAG TPA: GDSL-type esterase/lipase family protein [Marmoricola sp.]|nr:GDSL-type esterase/lipase family protein [Marmoricola sp.]
MTRLTRVLLEVAGVLAVAAASIAVALLVTPMQKVSAAGQSVQVGTTAPSWSLSGPAQLDLFGQHIPTNIIFFGPVRPRLVLTHITLSSQLKTFVGGSTEGLEDALATGFRHYFYAEIVIAGLAAVVLMGAVTGWLRHQVRHTVVLVVAALLVTEAVNLGAVMLTAYTAPAKLRQVHSLQALVGSAPRLPDPPTSADKPPGTRVVVMGDSTASGWGLRPLPHGSKADRACNRSRDSYARDLADANGWHVTNLACSDATIAEGVLGPQEHNGQLMPAQISDPAVGKASVVILSIGANDVEWGNLLRVCAVSPTCDDKAARAYFQQHLASFSAEYLQLLSDLQLLPNHPQVVVNLYYAPIEPDDDCLEQAGVTTEKQQSVLTTLSALNSILEKGAEAASFQIARPDFSGHGVCSDSPYVQGLRDYAPFHPNASGELAIALSVEHALQAAADPQAPLEPPTSSPSEGPTESPAESPTAPATGPASAG